MLRFLSFLASNILLITSTLRSPCFNFKCIYKNYAFLKPIFSLFLAFKRLIFTDCRFLTAVLFACLISAILSASLQQFNMVN